MKLVSATPSLLLSPKDDFQRIDSTNSGIREASNNDSC